MKKILAVSGGIDSMVLLDFVVKNLGKADFLVATVDHGMRDSSAADAEFVKKKCDEYGVECRILRLCLPADASEAEARDARYAALRALGARPGEFEIWTAHHLDDLVESVAINFVRGTGWRGLAAMRSRDIRRPFVSGGKDKRWILKYAARHEISWREDPTNASDLYLRNRLRMGIRNLPREVKIAIYELWKEQCEIYSEVETALDVVMDAVVDGVLPRRWFGGLEDPVADEIIRAWLSDMGISATRPQRTDFLRAIRGYAAGKKFNLPGDKLVKIGREIRL